MYKTTTILLVESQPMTHPHLTNALCQEGYRVIEASSGHQAMEHLAKSQVDLLIIDHEVDDMKGIDLLERLRQCSTYAQLPVLMLMEQESLVEIRHQTSLTTLVQ